MNSGLHRSADDEPAVYVDACPFGGWEVDARHVPTLAGNGSVLPTFGEAMAHAQVLADRAGVDVKLVCGLPDVDEADR